MKFRQIMMVAAFVIAVGSAFASKKHTQLVDNRRDASCQSIQDDCNDSGPHSCQQVEYLLNDTNCQTRQFQKP